MLSCLLKFSFGGQSVKDEANPICAAERKGKLRFLSENPIWNLIEKAGAEAGGAGRAGGATGEGGGATGEGGAEAGEGAATAGENPILNLVGKAGAGGGAWLATDICLKIQF